MVRDLTTPQPRTELEVYRGYSRDLERENKELTIALYVMAGLFLLFIMSRR